MKQSTQPFQGRFLGKRTDNPGFGNPGLKYTIPSGLTSISSSLSDFRGHTERASLVYGESI